MSGTSHRTAQMSTAGTSAWVTALTRVGTQSTYCSLGDLYPSSPAGLTRPTQTPVSSAGTGYPVRGRDNTRWVRRRFTQLPGLSEEACELKRGQLNAFIDAGPWYDNAQLHYPTQLDFCTTTKDSGSYRCDLCKGHYTDAELARRCAMNDLNYHPPPPPPQWPQ